jgi:hypothetical protein
LERESDRPESAEERLKEEEHRNLVVPVALKLSKKELRSAQLDLWPLGVVPVGVGRKVDGSFAGSMSSDTSSNGALI